MSHKGSQVATNYKTVEYYKILNVEECRILQDVTESITKCVTMCTSVTKNVTAGLTQHYESYTGYEVAQKKKKFDRVRHITSQLLPSVMNSATKCVTKCQRACHRV
jgi:uncharacterized protein YfbU (UPF0304 family)